MPFYEIFLVLRPMPRKEIVTCLTKTANLLWAQNGALRKIEYLGQKKLLRIIRAENSEDRYDKAEFFIYHASLNSKYIPKIKPELALDLDVLKVNWNRVDDLKLPEDYECNLEEETLTPFYRPSIQALLNNHNSRLTNPKVHNREYHTVSRAFHSTNNNNMASSNEAPGLLSIFERNPKRLHRIQFLSQLFNQEGHELRIAGGAVRDILNGQTPTDIDLATTSKPEESLKIVERHQDMLRIIVTAAGQKHGTVAVKFKGLEDVDFSKLSVKDEGDKQKANDEQSSSTNVAAPVYDQESPFEITTLRCDSVTDGRHAEVEFIKDWKKDAERRDLTINAMFLTLDNGEIIDYFGGQQDLKDGRVRFVGDAVQRIREDYLRILRFFRFWSRYGREKQPDEATATAIKENLAGLDNISGERIWTEFKKIFSVYPTLSVVKLMLDMKLFEQFKINEIDRERLFDELPLVEARIQEYLETNLKLKLEQNPEDINLKKIKDMLPAILFSTVLENRDMSSRALERFKFSNLERDTLNYIIDNRATDTNQITIDSLKRELVMAPRTEIPITRNRIIAFLIYKGKLELIDEINNWTIPDIPISGFEIMAQIKARNLPKHRMKNIQQNLRDEWALSKFQATKEDLRKRLESELDSYETSDTSSSKQSSSN